MDGAVSVGTLSSPYILLLVNNMKTRNVFLFVALIAAVVILAPFLTIWSLNVLFPSLAIPYSLETWAAVILLSAAVRSNVTMKKD